MTNKQIAAFLRECAGRCPNTDDAFGGRTTIEVPGTRLRITCKYDRTSIEAVAVKYEKTRTQRFLSTHNNVPGVSINRPGKPSMRAFMQFWESGDWDNALEYLRLYDRNQWPRQAVELMTVEGGRSRP